MKVINWQEVISTHKTISGINSSGGRVNSLLCNAGVDKHFPNRIEDEHIFYYVNPSNHRSGCNALLESIKQQNIFPVFEKLGVDRWRAIGSYRVQAFSETPGNCTEFILEKA